MQTAEIFNIMRYAVHDGPGIRTTVFFKGCPLACAWCHNPESQRFQPDRLYYDDRCRRCGDCIPHCPQQAIERVNGDIRTSGLCIRCGECARHCAAEARKIAGRRMTVAEVIAEVEKDIVFFDESGGGVTLSGGEPASRPQFASALLKGCRERGIHSVLETCGYAQTDSFLHVAGNADLVLFDLKLLDADRHRRYTGVSNTLILRNLEALLRVRQSVIVRIPIIPGINDGDEDSRRTGEYLSRQGVSSVDLLPYHAAGTEKYVRLGLEYRLAGTPEPGPEQMNLIGSIFSDCGLSVRLGG